MSDLRESAQQAEAAFTRMGEAAETLAGALRSALAEVQRLQVERDQLLGLLASCPHGAVLAPSLSTYSPLAREFQTWLVANGLRPSSARVYRYWVRSASAREGADRDGVVAVRATADERIALRRWHAFLKSTGRNAA